MFTAAQQAAKLICKFMIGGHITCHFKLCLVSGQQVQSRKGAQQQGRVRGPIRHCPANDTERRLTT